MKKPDKQTGFKAVKLSSLRQASGNLAGEQDIIANIHKILGNLLESIFIMLIILIAARFLLKDFFLDIEKKTEYESNIIKKEAIEILKKNYSDFLEIKYVKIKKRKTTLLQTPKITRGVYEYKFISANINTKLYIGWKSMDNGNPEITNIEMIDNEGQTVILYDEVSKK